MGFQGQTKRASLMCVENDICFVHSVLQVFMPLSRISAVLPVTMKENPSERYIQIVTVDGHDFWFMGFVNYEKASAHLSEALSHISVSK